MNKIKSLKSELTKELLFFKEVEKYINPEIVCSLPACEPFIIGYGFRKSSIDKMCEKYPEFKNEYINGLKEIEQTIAVYGFSEYTIYDFLFDNSMGIDSALFSDVKEKVLIYYKKLNETLKNIRDKYQRGVEFEIFLINSEIVTNVKEKWTFNEDNILIEEEDRTTIVNFNESIDKTKIDVIKLNLFEILEKERWVKNIEKIQNRS